MEYNSKSFSLLSPSPTNEALLTVNTMSSTPSIQFALEQEAQKEKSLEFDVRPFKELQKIEPNYVCEEVIVLTRLRKNID